MGGNLRLCSNMQKATPYRGGIQISPSVKEWAVERDMEKQKVHQKDKAGMLVLQDRLYFSFIFYEVSWNQFSFHPYSSFLLYLHKDLSASIHGKQEAVIAYLIFIEILNVSLFHRG